MKTDEVECAQCGEATRVPGSFDEAVDTAYCSGECWEASKL